MTRTTFGALPMGAEFFYRSRFWKKKRLYQRVEDPDDTLPKLGAVWVLNGTLANSFANRTPVWVEREET